MEKNIESLPPAKQPPVPEDLLNKIDNTLESCADFLLENHFVVLMALYQDNIINSKAPVKYSLAYMLAGEKVRSYKKAIAKLETRGITEKAVFNAVQKLIEKRLALEKNKATKEEGEYPKIIQIERNCTAQSS